MVCELQIVKSAKRYKIIFGPSSDSLRFLDEVVICYGIRGRF